MKQSLDPRAGNEQLAAEDLSANSNNNINNRLSRSNGHAHHRHHSSRPSTFDQLIEACKRKDLASIQSIVGGRPELVNKRDRLNRNLLHYSVILVQSGESTKFQKTNSEQVEANRLLESRSLDCFSYLIDRGDIKLWWQQDADGLSVLHLAVISSNLTLVRHLIYEHPYSTKYPLVCTLDNEHHSPLHWAVITNNLDCVKLLINYAGVKLAHEPDLNGATPLHYATQISDYPKYRQQLRDMLKSVGSHQYPSSQVIQWLTSMDSVHRESDDPQGKAIVRGNGQLAQQQRQWMTTNYSSMDATSDTTSTGGYEVLEYLVRLPQVNLECVDKDRRTPLLWAASSGCREAIVLLVSRGANINCSDINRLSPLHCAASHGFTECLECLLNLSQGSGEATQNPTTNDNNSNSNQVNQSDSLNCTPLFYSVLSGNIDCIELLLDRGAKCDWQDAKGRTAAHFAALKGQLNSLKLLQDRGANLWLPNKQGDLPLHYAIKSGRQQVVRWLLENSPYERAINAINNFGRAPIHLAIIKDNASMAEYLIQCGANLNQLVKVRDRLTSSKSATQGNMWSSLHDTSDSASGEHTTPSNEAPLMTKQQQQQQQQQVVNTRTKNGSSYHYETAMDMASKLGHHDCLKLLIAHNALPAAKVLADRQTGNVKRSIGNSMSLFDLQSVDGPSPIGFDTSSSSASTILPMNQTPQQVGTPTNLPAFSRMPKLTRPAPDSLPMSDSTGSSALSQNSMNSVRGLGKLPQKSAQFAPKTTQPIGRSSGDGRQQSELVDRERASYPCKGGISYNNDLMDASIKCRVYSNPSSHPLQHQHQHRSFPETNNVNHQLNQRVRIPRSTSGAGGRSSRSAEAASGYSAFGSQEIVTNVNVYTTSPCAHCMHNQLVGDDCIQCAQLPTMASPQQYRRHQQQRSKSQGRAASSQMVPAARRSIEVVSGDDSDLTSEMATGGESEQEVGGENQLPAIIGQKNQIAQKPLSYNVQHQHQQRPNPQLRHLPPSQGYEQHLPVILSEQERSTSATSNEQSPMSAGGELRAEVPLASAPEEPRFDRAQRSPSRRVDKYRDLVRSPVADYIHSGSYPTANRSPADHLVRSNMHIQQQQQQPVRVDYSQVRPKVDSRWSDGNNNTASTQGLPYEFTQATSGRNHGPEGADSGVHTATTTMETMRQRGGGQYMQSPGAQLPAYETNPTRSVSRQTIIKTRRLSVDSVELATTIEKSIRKYKQETKLFEELQNLKRSQIRSGRANEALLVKRLIEHFSNEVAPLDLLEPYHGPYTYKSYERFLYDQLRKLSQSNQAKLSKVLTDDQLEAYNQQRDLYHTQLQRQLEELANNDVEERNYADEDLKAELELRKVMESADGRDDSNSLILETSGALEDIRVKGKSGDSMNIPESHSLDAQKIDRELIEHKQQSIDKTSAAMTEIEKELEQPEVLGGKSVETREDQGLRKASVSSINSSSRRSSADIERERMLSLPLRTGSGDEVSQNANENDNEEQQEIETEPFKEEIHQIVAEQANSLASSIVVDALGNVSRIGSANKSIPAEESSLDCDHELNGSYPREDINYELEAAPDEYQKSTSGSEKRELIQGEVLKSPPGGGRRRSVVNIGDKMEVIYHNVGIEIDKVPDGPETSDELQQTQVSVGESVDELKQKDIEEQQKVQEKLKKCTRVDEEEEDVDAIDEKEPEPKEEKSQVELDADVTEEEQSQEEIETKSKDDPDLQTANSIQKQYPQTQMSRASGRRVSSPPAIGRYGSVDRKSSVTSSQDYVVQPTKKKRSQSIGRQQFVDQKQQQFPEARKVFNGHDLDEMHADRRSKKSSGSATGVAEESLVRRGSQEESEPPVDGYDDGAGAGDNGGHGDQEQEERIATGEETSKVSKQLSDEGEEVAKVLAKIDKLDGESSRQSSFGDRATDEGFVSRSTIQRSSQRIELTPLGGRDSIASVSSNGGGSGEATAAVAHKKQKPKMERSFIPKGRYVIQVPIGEIQARWSEVKQRERVKRRAHDGGLKRLEMHYDDGDNHQAQQEPTQLLWIGVGEHHQAHQNLSIERRLDSMAKSQPNLTDNEDQRIELTMQDSKDFNGNYILLYEINKHKHKRQQVGHEGEAAMETSKVTQQKPQRRDGSATQIWCHRRAIRILDVRSLKRTLSLPESLIYSNDLLKKFNILKL